MTKKLEKFSDFSKGDNDFNLFSVNKLLKIPSEIIDIREEIANISSEIKALQRSIAIMMKQDLPKILCDELIRLNGGL
jgi:hypothetical protein